MGHTLSNLQNTASAEKNVDDKHVYSSGDTKTPPASRHILAADPRSPSQTIPRTPIEVERNPISLNVKKKILRKANKIMNPFKTQEALLPTHINGETYSYIFFWGSRITREHLDWILNSAHNNGTTFYEFSKYGQNLTNEKCELCNSSSKDSYLRTTSLFARDFMLFRYVLVQNSSFIPVGYCRYRFKLDNGFADLCCCEILVEKDYRLKGIGSALLSVLFILAKRVSMDRISVKLFSSDSDSLNFFRKNGFISYASYKDVEENSDNLSLVKFCCS